MMSITATPVKDAYLPTVVISADKSQWLVFHYTDEDKDPWKWPKVMECGVRYFRWMSWDSDRRVVNYKECKPSEIAYAYKKKK
jgi:hypothetical protein